MSSSSSYRSNQLKRSVTKSATAARAGFGRNSPKFSMNEQPQNNNNKQEVIDLLDSDDSSDDEEEDNISVYQDDDDSIFRESDDGKSPASRSRGNHAGAGGSSSSTSNRKKHRSWDERFELLVEYKARHGNTLVPRKDPQLGQWVHDQRAAYSRKQRGVEDPKRRNRWISDHHEKCLNDIGFSWAARLEASVPVGDQEDDDKEGGDDDLECDDEDDDSNLSDDERKPSAASGTTSGKRKQRTWDESFALLVKYKERHGNALVPSNDPQLGTWVHNQRAAFSRKQRGVKPNSGMIWISDVHEKQLKNIGFSWTVCRGAVAGGQDDEDDDEYDDARDLECDDDDVGDFSDEDKKPSASRRYKDSSTKRKKRTWDESFALLIKYKEHHGNTLVLSRDPQLGTWVQAQRTAYWRKQQGVEAEPKNGRKRWISKEQEELLNDIGFSWTARRAAVAGDQKDDDDDEELGDEEEENGDVSDYSDDDKNKMTSNARKKKKKRSWDECFQLLLEYKSRNGHTRVPVSDPLLGKWVKNQRAAYSHKQRGMTKKSKSGCYMYHISQVHEEALDKIGFLWNVPSKSPQGSQRSGSAVDDDDEEEMNGVSMMSRDTTHAAVKPSTGPAAHNDGQMAAATMRTPHQDEPSSLTTQKRKRHRTMEDLQQRNLSNSSTATEATPETMSFHDIVGHGNAKSCIEDILLTLVPPVSVDDPIAMRICSQPTSIFLHGPTGCGKTQLARAIAGEAKAAFLSVTPSDIFGEPSGELETAIQSIVQQAKDRASQVESKCAVILFDQVDAFGSQEIQSDQDASRSRRVRTELCNQLDTLHQQKQAQNQSKTTYPLNVLIVAATNCRQHCDPALLRRFGARLHVGLPSEGDRQEMLKRKLSQVDNVVSQDQLLDIVDVMEGWSGAEVESLVYNASLAPVREYLRATRERRQQLQQTGGTLSITDEGITTEHQSQGLRPVALADFEEAYHMS